MILTSLKPGGNYPDLSFNIAHIIGDNEDDDGRKILREGPQLVRLISAVKFVENFI